MEQAYAQMRRKLRMTRLAEDIGHKIMVLSGKGGVGKSTVATGLALSLAKQGKKVGILDIDITGPNIPKMLGIEETELHVEDNQIHPADGPNGLKVMSMAFLLEDPDKPIIWRGPIKLGAIQQFIGDVAWGKADPNSSVSVMGPRGLPLDATADDAGDWAVTLNLFKQGGGEAAAEEFEVPFLGSLPFDPGVVRGGDDGIHRIVAEPEGETAQAFDVIVENLLEELAKGEDDAPEIL